MTAAWWGSEESSDSGTKQHANGSEQNPRGRSGSLTLCISEDGT